MTDPKLKALCGTVYKDLSEGRTLAASMRAMPETFDATMTHLLDAGEATVCYDPAQVSDASLVDCIRDLGFVVESVQPKETST